MCSTEVIIGITIVVGFLIIVSLLGGFATHRSRQCCLLAAQSAADGKINKVTHEPSLAGTEYPVPGIYTGHPSPLNQNISPLNESGVTKSSYGMTNTFGTYGSTSNEGVGTSLFNPPAVVRLQNVAAAHLPQLQAKTASYIIPSGAPVYEGPDSLYTPKNPVLNALKAGAGPGSFGGGGMGAPGSTSGVSKVGWDNMADYTKYPMARAPLNGAQVTSGISKPYPKF